MADIFISYKSERRPAAQHLATIFRHYGYSTWFDYQLIKGRDFAFQIDAKARAAKAVVVLWCGRSVQSRWVGEEADLALSLGKLVPVKIEPCELRAGFRLADYVDLAPWDGAPRSHHLDALFDAVERLTGKAPVPNVMALREYEGQWRLFGAPPLAKFALEAELELVEGARPLPGREPFASATAPPPPPRPGADVLSWSQAQWEQLKQSTDRKRLKIFAETAHPYYAHEAQERLAVLEAAEETARRQAAEEAEAKRKAEAERRRIEELTLRHEADWQAARVADTIAALEAFLAAWTGGPHVEEARRRLAELSAAAKAPPRPLIRTGQFKVMAGSKGKEWELWLTPGESVRDTYFTPEMVLVPPGKFWMGSKDGEGDGDERPRHEVTIGTPLLVGKYPVTFDEWDAYVAKAGGGGFLGIGGSKPHKPGGQGWGRGRRPVIHVSWDDAKAYAKWLFEATGKGYRLLSEAEWEYCCRAGTETQYSFGDDETALGDYAWFSSNSGGKTQPVGQKKANAFGLHDMHGNVWEWCEDPWHENYKGAPVDGSVWSAGGNINARVLRGGSWSYFPQVLRSANRVRYYPGDRSYSGGFRLGRMLTP